jgi:Fic family protein
MGLDGMLNAFGSDNMFGSFGFERTRHVSTTLNTIDSINGIIHFEYDVSGLAELEILLNNCKRANIDERKLYNLLLIDSYHSATMLEGATVTMQDVLSGVQNDAVSMILQNSKAMEYLFNCDDVTEATMLQAREMIVDGTCRNTDAGRNGYRTGAATLSNDFGLAHTPASAMSVPRYMHTMFDYTNGSEILDAIVKHFYIAYIHPFCDGNCRIARAVCIRTLGLEGLPLSKAISLNTSRYYKAFRDSENIVDGHINITPFVDYMFDIITSALQMYAHYTNDLTSEESQLLDVLQKSGELTVGSTKVSRIFNSAEDVATDMLNSLVCKGYAVFNAGTNDYTLIWR